MASVTKVGAQTGSLTEAGSKVNVRGHFAGKSDAMRSENSTFWDDSSDCGDIAGSKSCRRARSVPKTLPAHSPAQSSVGSSN